MKKITLLFALIFFVLNWQTNAQFLESFDTEIPSTWTIISADANSTYTWRYTTDNPHSGAGQAEMHWESNTHDDYLISPSFTVTSGVSDKLSFYAAIYSSNWTETFDVMLSTTAGNTVADLDVTLGNETATAVAPNHELFEYDLTAYIGQTVTIAIRATDTNRHHLYIDDFLISNITACSNPSNITLSNIVSDGVQIAWTDNAGANAWEYVVQTAGTGMPTSAGIATSTNPTIVSGLTSETDYEVFVRASCSASDFSSWIGPMTFTTAISCLAPSNYAVSNITTNSATVSWTDNANASEWAYVIQPAGGTTPTGTGTIVTSPSVNLSGLSAATVYEFFARANCSSTDYSDWTSFTFNSGCNPFTAPYSQNFDNVTIPDLPVCWSKIVHSNYSDDYIQSFEFLSPSTPNVIKFTGRYATLILVSPEFSDLTSQQNRITFKARGLISPYGDFIIGTMSDPTDENTFVAFQTFTLTGSYETYTVNFDNTYTESNHYIAFKHGGANDPIYLDDFVYENNPAAISNNRIKGFNYYPNPVNNTLNLSAQDNIEKINIYNISGQEVMNITPNSLQTQVDMSRLQNGIYFVKAQINGQLTAFKVVKK